MARRKKNPLLGVSWLWWGLGAAGAYYLYARPKMAGRPTGVAEAKRIATSSRYEWQYFGKGADADAVCRDKLKRSYVDDAICDREIGPSGAQLEGVGNYVRI
jgi:hypothetical protein